MVRCSKCGSHKAGQDRICWKCNPQDRRYSGTPISITERKDYKDTRPRWARMIDWAKQKFKGSD